MIFVILSAFMSDITVFLNNDIFVQLGYENITDLVE